MFQQEWQINYGNIARQRQTNVFFRILTTYGHQTFTTFTNTFNPLLYRVTLHTHYFRSVFLSTGMKKMWLEEKTNQLLQNEGPFKSCGHIGKPYIILGPLD